MNIKIYTDGSLTKRQNKIYCGYAVYFPNEEIKNSSNVFKIEPITNNRAELYAIYISIKKCYQLHKTTLIKNIYIYSDSEYSVKTINVWYATWIKKNKLYLNKDIIDKIINLKNKCDFNVHLIHIHSHTGLNDEHTKNNDIVDKMAKKACLKNYEA